VVFICLNLLENCSKVNPTPHIFPEHANISVNIITITITWFYLYNYTITNHIQIKWVTLHFDGPLLTSC